jgi:hypothetical protein
VPCEDERIYAAGAARSLHEVGIHHLPLGEQHYEAVVIGS